MSKKNAVEELIKKIERHVSQVSQAEGEFDSQSRHAPTEALAATCAQAGESSTSRTPPPISAATMARALPASIK